MKEYSVISNSTPLIAFIKKNELSIIKKLFNKFIIPKAVNDEIVNVHKSLENEIEILESEIKKECILIKKIKNLKFAELNLGRGETEAINACLEVNEPLLLIDEKKDKKFITVSFKENGIGSTKDQINRIFYDFYMADESRRRVDSSGLGLAICKRIVKKHGGKICV